MDTKDEEFLKHLQIIFRVEAKEHIRELSSGLIELEKTPKAKNTSELIETIFREAHSLKGAARSVNMKDVESICHLLETIFGKLKNEQISSEDRELSTTLGRTASCPWTTAVSRSTH